MMGAQKRFHDYTYDLHVYNMSVISCLFNFKVEWPVMSYKPRFHQPNGNPDLAPTLQACRYDQRAHYYNNGDTVNPTCILYEMRMAKPVPSTRDAIECPVGFHRVEKVGPDDRAKSDDVDLDRGGRVEEVGLKRKVGAVKGVDGDKGFWCKANQ